MVQKKSMKSKLFPKSDIVKEDIERIIDLVPECSLFENKKILITGADGMIPSYFVYLYSYLNEFMFKKKCEIHVVVRNKKFCKRIAAFLNKPYVKTIVQDVSKRLNVEEPFAYIIHAASTASPEKYTQEPVQTINTNVLGLYSLLALPQVKLESLLFFSTAELYGSPQGKDIPIREDYVGSTNFHDIRSCYVESKRFGEVICMNYFREYKTPIKIIRPFHVYSPEIDLRDKRIFAAFVKSALEGKDIEINGDGKPTRSLCYITDAIVMILKTLLSDHNGQVFNIGNQKNEISVKDLAILITKISGNKINVKIHGMKNKFGSAPIRSCPDMSKVKKFLKIEPTVDLESGFSRVFSYQRELNP